MSSNTPNNNDQEIDLRQVSQKMGQAYENFLSWIFRGFLFVKRNLIVLIILFVIGAGIGYYLDKKTNSYSSEIIVKPNYKSTDYMYSKVELLQSKIKEGDTVFLKKIGIKKSQKLSFIEIKPIVDVYKFIENNEQNFELIKLMAEDGDLNKIVQDKVTSKNYPFHSIYFTTGEITDQKNTVEPIINFLNDSDYYAEQKRVHIENIKMKMVSNDSIIKQIDAILNMFSKNQSGAKGSQLVYYNENTQLNEMLKTKELLIQDNANIRIELLSADYVVKLNSSVLNIKDTKSINEKMKFILPIVFILLFLIINSFLKFYKSQLRKINT